MVENEFQIGQKVWVYDCPRLLKGTYNGHYYEGSHVLARVKIRGENFYHEFHRIFRRPEDYNSLVCILTVDLEELQKYLDWFKKEEKNETT